MAQGGNIPALGVDLKVAAEFGQWRRTGVRFNESLSKKKFNKTKIIAQSRRSCDTFLPSYLQAIEDMAYQGLSSTLGSF